MFWYIYQEKPQQSRVAAFITSVSTSGSLVNPPSPPTLSETDLLMSRSLEKLIWKTSNLKPFANECFMSAIQAVIWRVKIIYILKQKLYLYPMNAHLPPNTSRVTSRPVKIAGAVVRQQSEMAFTHTLTGSLVSSGTANIDTDLRLFGSVFRTRSGETVGEDGSFYMCAALQRITCPPVPIPHLFII